MGILDRIRGRQDAAVVEGDIFQEVTDFQRQLADEQKEGYWSALDKAGSKRNRSWADVEAGLKEVYAAWCVNPLAKSYCDYQRYFVIGQGTQINTPEEDGPDAQERVRIFAELSDWSILEKQICEELSRDGEVFVRFHGRNKYDFKTDIQMVTLIDPLEVMYIDCAEVGKPKRYLRKYLKLGEMDDTGAQSSEETTEWIAASEIIHIRVNASFNELRGRSDLLVVLPWLKQLKRWLDDMSRRNYMMGAFNWDVTISPPLNVASVKKTSAPMPGTTIYHSKLEEWKPISPDMRHSDTTAGARAIKLLVCAGYKMPESWFGDTGESNLATTQALAMPTLRAFIDRQDTLKYYFEEIIKRGASVENVDVVFPELVAEEMSAKANALKALSEALMNLQTTGMMSKESGYKVIQGYLDDLDEWADDRSGVGEKLRIDKEEQEEAVATAQGRRTKGAFGLLRPSLEKENPPAMPEGEATGGI